MSCLKLKFVAYLACTAAYAIVGSEQNYMTENFPATVIEDANLDTAQLVHKYQYPIETHYVTTEDSYILCMHRIARPAGRPVFLMHGLLDSSATWIEMGPWNALGYFLYDNGYDVWMGNARGNRYSRNHTIFNPDIDKSFWQFSWHEIGYYDLPAMLDYVLKKTGARKLGYFGHSQGTTTFFAMCSMRPEYNKKITIMLALAPVAFMKNVKSPLVGVLSNFLLISKDIVTEFMPHTDIFLNTCFRTKITLDACLDSFWLIVGKDPQQLNMTMLPVVYSHLPAGCNLKQWQHFVQMITSDRFCQYDYGAIENMRRYGRLLPPDYPLEKVTATVGLYYAHNDYLTSVEDVQHLAGILPNVVDNHLYPYKNWNHMSMVWGMEARELSHKHLLKMLRKFE